jgi:hypothetical protein
MTPYIVRFNHAEDDGKLEEMFLCLHAKSLKDAAEKFWSMLGGVGQPNVLVSVKDDTFEYFYDRSTGRFTVVPS